MHTLRLHLPTIFIPPQLGIAQLAERRTKVHVVVLTHRHLVRRTLQVRLEDHLAIEIDDEVAHRLGKQVVGMLYVMLVNGEVVCDEDRERVASPATRPSSLLALARCWGDNLALDKDGENDARNSLFRMEIRA